MVYRPEEVPKQARLPESALVYDITTHKYVTAYRKDFKRQETIILIPTVSLDDDPTSVTGKAFEVPAYKRALILIDVDVTSDPTDVLFSIEFSSNQHDWYKYMVGPFGDLRYEDGAGDLQECLDIPILAPWMRAKAVATGSEAGKIFKVTVRAVLNG